MKSLPLAPSPFPAFYDHRKGGYLLDADHGWTHFCKQDLKQHMIRAGWNPKKVPGEALSPLDRELMRIQIDNKIDYWGSVAGHPKGLITMGSSRILVTESYKRVIPVKGEWPLLAKLIDNLLDRIDAQQKPIFYSWCAIYLRSLESNIFMPGQMLLLAGPRNCGKSFLQNRLTTLLGGRSANPWPYMSGSTDFNSDLFEREHLQAEDPAVSRLADRLDFGSRIKQFTVNEIQPCHPKNRDIVTLQPRWRFTVSINDEPYYLRAIPPIDDSTADKIIIFKCAADSVPCTSDNVDEREAFRLAVESELPAFTYFLLHEWQVPKHLKSGRFGVTHYHHPEILAEINENSPEFDLVCTLDSTSLFGTSGCWIGNAKQLAKFLASCIDDGEALRLAKSERALSLRLASTARKYPQRVVAKKGSKGQRMWIIYKNELANG